MSSHSHLRRRLGSESEKEPLVSFDSNTYPQKSNSFADGVRHSDGMTSRDRTREFLDTAKSMQRRQTNGAIAVKENHRNKTLSQYSEFMRIARLIGRDIQNTYAKLEKLTMLAKRKSLFDDKPHEIQELTYIIKQDMGSLNNQIAKLGELGRRQGSTASTHMKTHSNSVVVSLQSKLASMSNDFKQILEVRTENLKAQKSRRDQFSQGAVSSSLPPSAIKGYHTGSVLLADEPNGDVAIDIPHQQDQRRQQMLMDETDSYLASRAETMQNIESTIVELGGIFTQLATMIKEQEEMVQRIDHNVDDAGLNVEAAHGEILKYFRSVSSNRWLMVKVFAVLIFFFIIFVIFLA